MPPRRLAGHVNNVEYYPYFDTVINRWLITAGWFVHVFVDRHARRPSAIPEGVRGALARLEVS